MTKRCPRCGHHLPVEVFNRDKNTPDGRAVYCRSCRRNSRSGRTPADQLTAAADQAEKAINARAARGHGYDMQAQRAVTELRLAAERWH